MTFGNIKLSPDRWFRSADFDVAEDSEFVAEGGGLIRWCTRCRDYDVPNRPCACIDLEPLVSGQLIIPFHQVGQ